jgi:NAD(P)-dependent dehydrogenase (short-subunit alcohol dehydrogenase family)
MEAKLENKVGFVTGAARGFGKAFTQALCARGAKVVMTDIDVPAVEAAAAEVRAAGGQAMALTCDVSNETQVADAMRRTKETWGGLDILINNAGLHSEEYNMPMVTAPLAKIRKLFDVNQMGVVICTLAALPLMEGRAGASIVNISSSAGYPCPTAYGVTKLAVRGLTATFARELGPKEIRVNAIAPGLIFTDTIRAELNPRHVAAVKGQQAIDVEGEESDIVNAMLYLVSPEARFVTGETLKVAGGFTMGIG